MAFRGLEQIPFLYDGFMALAEATGLKKWRRWLAEGARGRTLDLGCGSGRNLPLFGANVTAVGLDPTEHALRAARKKAPGVPLVRASGEALPFKAGVFETVVAGLCLCSIPSPETALGDIRRVLAPGGTLRALEHVRSKSPFWARFQDRAQPAWTAVTGGCHPNRETERAVEAAGFAIQPEGRREKGTMRRFWARSSQ